MTIMFSLVYAQNWEQSYIAGSMDSQNIFMGGSEILNLETHKNRLYASLGYWEDENNIWFTNEKIETIKSVHKYLESRIEIGKVTSIYSLIDTANQINKSDLSMFELSVLYNEIPIDYKTDLIDPYLNVEKNMIKISTRVKDSKNIKRNDLINDINSFLLNEILKASGF